MQAFEFRCALLESCAGHTHAPKSFPRTRFSLDLLHMKADLREPDDFLVNALSWGSGYLGSSPGLATIILCISSVQLLSRV